MKIAVVGSRSFTDRKFIWSILDHVYVSHGPFQVVSGGAAGVDSIAVAWANRLDDVPIPLVFPAEWGNLSLPGCVVKVRPGGERYNATAGFYRNQLIVNASDRVLAFVDYENPTPGTLDTIKKGLARGIPVHSAYPGKDRLFYHWESV